MHHLIQTIFARGNDILSNDEKGTYGKKGWESLRCQKKKRLRTRSTFRQSLMASVGESQVIEKTLV